MAMRVATFILLATLLALWAESVSAVCGQTCSESSSTQRWTFDRQTGQLRAQNGLCLAAESSVSSSGGTNLHMSSCINPTPAGQAFSMQTSGVVNLVLMSDHETCVNLENYGKTPGSTVWLYKPCNANDCHGEGGNCAWVTKPVGSAYVAFSLHNSSHSNILTDMSIYSSNPRVY